MEESVAQALGKAMHPDASSDGFGRLGAEKKFHAQPFAKGELELQAAQGSAPG